MQQIGTECFEGVRIPEVSRVASRLIYAVEDATPAAPVAIDTLLPSHSEAALEAHLQGTDELYARHDELFFRDGVPPIGGPFAYEGILALSRDIIHHVKEGRTEDRAGRLGFAVLQLAEAAVRVAHDPSLVVSTDHDIAETLHKSGTLGRQVFHDTFASRVQGNILKAPSPRLGYAGNLMDTHRDFWHQNTAVGILPPEVAEKAQHLLPQFPAKALLLDAHSATGRPERHVARRSYQRTLHAYYETLKSGESDGETVDGNVSDVAPIVLEVLHKAAIAGYTTTQAVRIAARNASVVGRLSERTTVGRGYMGRDHTNKEIIQLEDDGENSRLIVGTPELIHHDAMLPRALAKLQRRDIDGGICPARYLVKIGKDEQTHQSLMIFGAAFEDRIGVAPSIVREIQGEIYVDPAVLLVDYMLFAISSNQRW